MLSSGTKDSDINGKKNIPLVKHPLINTNLFPGKAALEERFFFPHMPNCPALIWKIFHLVSRNIKKLHLVKIKKWIYFLTHVVYTDKIFLQALSIPN